MGMTNIDIAKLIATKTPFLKRGVLDSVTAGCVTSLEEHTPNPSQKGNSARYAFIIFD